MISAEPPAAFTISDFCMTYSVGKTLVYRQIASGSLKAKKVGNRTLILRSDAEEWVRSLPDARK